MKYSNTRFNPALDEKLIDTLVSIYLRPHYKMWRVIASGFDPNLALMLKEVFGRIKDYLPVRMEAPWVHLMTPDKWIADNGVKFLKENDLFSWMRAPHRLSLSKPDVQIALRENIMVTTPEAYPEYRAEYPNDVFKEMSAKFAAGILHGEIKAPLPSGIQYLFYRQYRKGKLYVMNGMGALGWHDFKTLITFMSEPFMPFDLLLLDTDHVRCAKAMEIIQKSKAWSVVSYRARQWCLASYVNSAKSRRRTQEKIKLMELPYEPKYETQGAYWIPQRDRQLGGDDSCASGVKQGD